MEVIENTSGQGASAAVPPEVEGWNWGAFLLTWIWGIGNSTYVALLMFVPLVNVVMPFMLGFKGSAWAWRNQRWRDVEHFRAVQRKWAWWGVGIIIAMLAMVALTVQLVFGMLAKSEPYVNSLTRVHESDAVSRIVGQPLSIGSPSGQLEESGPSGQAALSYTVEGPRGSGTAYLEATKSMGLWHIDSMVFEDAATGARVSLNR